MRENSLGEAPAVGYSKPDTKSHSKRHANYLDDDASQVESRVSVYGNIWDHTSTHIHAMQCASSPIRVRARSEATDRHLYLSLRWSFRGRPKF